MQKIWQSLALATIMTLGGYSDNVLASNPTAREQIRPPAANTQRLAQRRRAICANMAFRNNDGILHEGKLMLNNRGNGSMQVKYFNSRVNRSEVIIQTMTVQDSPYGTLIVGSNPVYAGTRARNLTYHPDNFLLNIQENGNYLLFAFDGQGTKSPVDVTDCN